MWPEQTETQELLVQAKQGEPAAVDRLLARHREPIRRLIGLRLDPAIAGRVDASDIVQDVLLEASQRLNEYLKNPSMPFHLWLRYIAGDHIKDAYRRHRKARRRTVDRERPLQNRRLDQSSLELAGDLIDREFTPATAALRQEMQQAFLDTLWTLDKIDREIILMRHFEHLSNQEVADALKLTEAAASMRYLRAIRRLRERLAPKDSSG